MDEVVEIIYSLVGGFFEFSQPKEKVSKKIKRIVIGIFLFILLFFILIIYIIVSTKNFVVP